MPSEVSIKPAPTTSTGPRHFSVRPMVIVVIVIAVLGILAVIASRQWPFTRNAVAQALQQQSGSTVQIGAFRHTYFPHPGCVAEGLTFRRSADPASPPFITIGRLTIVGSYPDLFRHRVEQIRVEDMHVVLPPVGESEASSMQGISMKWGIAIGELIVERAQLEITSEKPGQEALAFPIQQLSLTSISDGHPLAFRVQMKIPKPVGDLNVTGQFGPWKSGDGGHAPLSGSYSLKNADLGVFSGIAGTVSAQGT